MSDFLRQNVGETVALGTKVSSTVANGLFTLAKFVKRHVTVTIVLALATLGNATQIGSFLFMSLHPRWSRQASSDCCCGRRYCVTFANVNTTLVYCDDLL